MQPDQIVYGSMEWHELKGHKVVTAGFKRPEASGPYGEPFYCVTWRYCCTCQQGGERVGRWSWC